MLHSMHACSRADFVACASKRLLQGYRRIGIFVACASKRLLQATDGPGMLHGRVSESAAPPAQVSRCASGAEVLRWAFADTFAVRR
jgi:hypothetical protein